MNISINYKPIKNPYGGANQFVTNLCNFLKKKHRIFFDLRSEKLDIILIIEN